MFKLNGNTSVKIFSVALDSILWPYWRLLCILNPNFLKTQCLNSQNEGLVKKTEDLDKKIYDLENTDNEEEKGKLSQELDDSRREVAENCLSVFGSQIVSSLFSSDYLPASIKGVLIIYYDNGKYYAIQRTSKEKNVEIIGYFASLLCKKKILNSLSEANGFDQEYPFISEDDQVVFYKRAIKVYSTLPQILPVCPMSFVSLDDLTLEIVETENIWINRSELKSLFGIDFSKIDKISILRADKDIIVAVTVNGYAIDISGLLQNFINPEYEYSYIWWMLSKDLLGQTRHKEYHGEDALCKEFLESSKEDSLSKVLCNLQDNLFVSSDVVIPETYHKYFMNLISFRELEGLEDFNILINDDANLVLDTYRYQKAYKSSDYNLMHSIARENTELKDYSRPNDRVSSKNVRALNPHLTLYYIEDFFEEYLYGIFKECYKSEDIIYNHEFLMEGGSNPEYDFIINRGESILFVEAKTTLCISQINTYVSRCLDVISAFPKLDGKLEFMIVGYHSSSELDLLINGFKDVGEYNKLRPEWTSKPYKFRVPIIDPKTKVEVGVLDCITDPDYSRLKQSIQQYPKWYSQ